MKNRKVLLVDLGTAFGGVAVYLTSLARLLQGRADLYALCLDEQLAANLRGLGVRVFCFPRVSQWGKLGPLLLGIASVLGLRLRYGIGAVWINGYTEVVLLPLARLLGCTAMATRHLSMDPEAPEWHNTSKGFVARLLYQHLAFTAHKIICVSGAVAEDLAQITSPTRLVTIHNWVPELPEQLKIERSPNAPVKLLFVGRLKKYKGASLIIEAMHRLKAGGNAHQVSLTIVGDGECREELERQAKGLDVQFAGFQSDTSRFYRNADIFVNPSVGPEGLPLVTLEAMSWGLPCIFSDLRVHKEITDDGECAMLFQSGNAWDLCFQIERLLASPELFQSYGNRARNLIQTRHSAEAARASYLRELDSALSRSSTYAFARNTTPNG